MAAIHEQFHIHQTQTIHFFFKQHTTTHDNTLLRFKVLKNTPFGSRDPNVGASCARHVFEIM